MDEAKRRRLEAAGFVFGDAADFLGLSEAESELVEVGLALGAGLRRSRIARQLSQAQLARLIHSSQSRVAKMEAADPSVSIDLVLRALLATGVTRRQVGELIASGAES